MQAKKKICGFCNTEQFIWKNVSGVKACKNCAAKHSTQKTKPTLEKKRYVIPARSTKKEKLDALYKIVRDAYLKAHPQCEAAIPGICSGKPADQVHHMRGKIGELYLDDRYFLALEFNCHRHIEDHPAYAVEHGFSKSRLKTTKDD